jgi:hypothetical protein
LIGVEGNHDQAFLSKILRELLGFSKCENQRNLDVLWRKFIPVYPPKTGKLHLRLDMPSILYTDPGALPVFSGFEEVSLASFSGRGILTGDDQNNRLIGSARQDSLTGGEGVDIFGINALTHSLLATFDVITDYNSQDRIDAPGTITGTITSSSGNASSLSSTAIAAVLTSGVFTANSARAFTVTGQSGTFIALNNGTAGFSSSADAILHLANFTIGVDNPVTII